MDGTNYIEIDSTYRDRTLWPSPSEFDVPFSMSGSRGQCDAFDPVSEGATRISWNSSFTFSSANYEISSIFITPTPSDPNNAGDNVRFLINVQSSLNANGVPIQVWRPEQDFYTGAVLNISNCRRRITKYNYIGINYSTYIDTAIITLCSKLPDSAVNSINGVIGNPSTDTTVSPNPQVFIPMGQSIDNYYINSYMTVILGTGGTQNTQYVQITDYNTITHMATLATPTTFNWNTIGSWGSPTFLIVDQLPMLNTEVVIGQGLYYQLAVPELSVLFTITPSFLPNPTNGFYNGDFLFIKQPVPQYPSQDVDYLTLQQLKIQNPQQASALSTSYPFLEMMGIANYISLDTTFQNDPATGNVFVFNYNASSVDNYYVNCYITTATWLTLNHLSPIPAYQITSYVGATRTGTINCNFNNETILSPASIRTVQLTQPFYLNVQPSSNVSVIQFSYDNFCPLSYNGTHSQEVACYEVEMLNCVLPNLTLIDGFGGLPAFYPEFYVELTVLTTPTKEPIYSNNPNAKKALFRAIVTDTYNPSRSPYVRLRTDCVKQHIKFNPRDTLHFAVKLPNGELIVVNQTEDYSPMIPNPSIQISAIFKIKRVDF